MSKKRRNGPRSFHFSAGTALAHTMSCLGRNFPVFSLFALVFFLPQALWALSHTAGALEDANAFGLLEIDFWDWLDGRGNGFVQMLLNYGLPILLQAVLTVAVFQFLSGDRVDYGKSFRRGIGNFFSVVGVALFVAVIIALVLIVFGLLVVPLLLGTGAGLVALTIVGILLLLVAVQIQSIFFVAIPAAVAEGRGPIAALARSSWLTSGARWKILGILVLFTGGSLLIVSLVRKLLGGDPQTLSTAQLSVVISVAVTAILSLFQAVATAVVYHDLRRAKEGVGVEELVRVFD